MEGGASDLTLRNRDYLAVRPNNMMLEEKKFTKK